MSRLRITKSAIDKIIRPLELTFGLISIQNHHEIGDILAAPILELSIVSPPDILFPMVHTFSPLTRHLRTAYFHYSLFRIYTLLLSSPLPPSFYTLHFLLSVFSLYSSPLPVYPLNRTIFFLGCCGCIGFAAGTSSTGVKSYTFLVIGCFKV